MLLLLAAVAVGDDAVVRLSGTLEPRWSSTPQDYGEFTEEPTVEALVLRLDAPHEGLAEVAVARSEYLPLPRYVPSRCLGGHVTVEGELAYLAPYRGGPTLVGSRIVACEPPPRKGPNVRPKAGHAATLTGVLHRWWWFGPPNYGTRATTVDLVRASVLVVDGVLVPLDRSGDALAAERHRRFLAACDHQVVTVRGTWRHPADDRGRPAYELADVSFGEACEKPALTQGIYPGTRPVPRAWLETMTPERRQWTGTLEARWWMLAPGFGELGSDEIEWAITLRPDVPDDPRGYYLYSSDGLHPLVEDAAAARCLGGRAVVEATLVPSPYAFAVGALTQARVVSCEPPELLTPSFGTEARLTGTLRRSWAYLGPSFGAEPDRDEQAYFAALEVDGRIVPLFPGRDGDLERHRRFGVACEGQQVTVTGTWTPAKRPETSPPYKLTGVRFEGPCVSPAFDRGAGLAPLPAPPAWLD